MLEELLLEVQKQKVPGQKSFSTPLPAHYQQQWDQVMGAYAEKDVYNTLIRTIQRLTERQKSECWYPSSFLNWRQLTLITEEACTRTPEWKTFCDKNAELLMPDPRQVSNGCQAAHVACLLGEQEKCKQSKEITILSVVAENQVATSSLASKVNAGAKWGWYLLYWTNSQRNHFQNKT